MEHSSAIFVTLVQNAALLLASALLFDLFGTRWKTESSHLVPKIVFGLILGVIGMVIMVTPWTYMPGVAFDTRSILIGTTGLFFGAVPTAVTMIMTSGLRILQGGSGIWMGVTVIVVSGLIGLAWRLARHHRLDTMTWRELLGFGLTLHLAMLASTIALPRNIAFEAFSHIIIPVLLIYPLSTALLGMLMVRRLVHERTEEQLRASKDELTRTLRIIDESINIIFVTDAEGTIKYVNRTFEALTGFSRNEALGRNPRILASGETPKSRYEAMWNAIKSGETWRGMIKNRKKDGGFYWANGFISPILDDQGQITHFMAIQEDITDKVASRQELRFLAEHDRITGLVNRHHFVEILDQTLAKSIEGRTVAGLLQIDIDGFKLINDAFGHTVGDQFLRELSEFFVQQIQKNELLRESPTPVTVGRLGGDEFGILLPDLDLDAALNVAESLRTSVEGGIFLAGTVRTTICLGLVEIPGHGTTSGELLVKVNAATATAKESGQNRCVIYQQGDAYLNEVHSSLKTKQTIIQALDADRFVPWFQPILDLNTGLVTHYEALARLVDETGKILAPAFFIPTAERFGLIYRIDQMIIEKTMRFQAELQARGLTLSFGVNISGKNLGDRELLSRLQTFMDESKADPGRIVFELTETAAIRNLKEAVAFVRALKEWGCKFSLDDFGVGFTSFAHLIEMEVDYLKIDGAFVRRLPDTPRDRILVKTIADMARGLGIRTVAEFVDQPETIRILRDIGVDFAQGYFIGRPAPDILERDDPDLEFGADS
ncbi:MAG: EAL domain-containing protein [Deltaproteobacteria bacterium]|nr:EAL domain-containing protein [Deltaproteobacteria bacterium]